MMMLILMIMIHKSSHELYKLRIINILLFYSNTFFFVLRSRFLSAIFLWLLYIPFYDIHYIAFMLIEQGYTFVQTISESVKVRVITYILVELPSYKVKI